MKNLYDVLEVSRSCTKETLDASYHRLAAELNDLINSNSSNYSEIKFRLDGIEHAHAVLSDPVKRREYDERIKGAEAAVFETSDNYFDDFLSALLDVAKRPIIVIVIIALIPLILYTTLDHGVKKTEINSKEVVSSKALDIVDASVENDRELQQERIALENARLQREVEILKMEQERRDRQLEYERELQAREIDLLRQEQERRDRRLEYEANAGDRVLGMEERKLSIAEREIRANRKTIDEHNNRVRIDRNVNDLLRAAELQRNAEAARLGITREQYERLLNEKYYYNR